MAVRPAWQRRGVGSALIAEGTRRLREAGAPFIIVLGHPDYYPRFGFEPASQYGVRCQWPGVPDEAFMVLVLDAVRAPRLGGVAVSPRVRYSLTAPRCGTIAAACQRPTSTR